MIIALLYAAIVALVYVLMGIYFALAWVGANLLAFLDKVLCWWGDMPPAMQWALSGFVVAAILHFAASEAYRLNRPQVSPLLMVGIALALMVSGLMHFGHGVAIPVSKMPRDNVQTPSRQTTPLNTRSPTPSRSVSQTTPTTLTNPATPPSRQTAPNTNRRVWTDSAGRKTEADFVKLENDNITLQWVGNGRTFTIPISELSLADQQFAKSLRPPITGGNLALNAPAIDSKTQPPPPSGRPTSHELTSYVARLSYEDHCNSSGTFLPNVPAIKPADILLQDRFNFHQNRHRDSDDTADTLWDTRGSAWLRDHFERVPVRYDSQLNDADILRRNSVVRVTVFEDALYVERVLGDHQLSPKSSDGSGTSRKENEKIDGNGANSTSPKTANSDLRPGSGVRVLRSFELQKLTTPPRDETWFVGGIQIVSRQGSTVIARPYSRVGDRVRPHDNVVLEIEFSKGIVAPSGWPTLKGTPEGDLVDLPYDHACKIQQWTSSAGGGARIKATCYGRLDVE